MGRWTVCTSESVKAAALAQARGSYQRAIVEGVESLSGSTLRGRARSYGYWYKRSRANFLGRLTAAGVSWSERRESRGARVLVLGKSAPTRK